MAAGQTFSKGLKVQYLQHAFLIPLESVVPERRWEIVAGITHKVRVIERTYGLHIGYVHLHCKVISIQEPAKLQTWRAGDANLHVVLVGGLGDGLLLAPWVRLLHFGYVYTPS